MARLWSSGFELNSLSIELPGSSGAISTTHVRSGTYAYETTGFSTDATYQYTNNAGLETYVRAYLYIAALPANNNMIVRISANGSPIAGSITLTTTGTLQLKQSDGTQIGSDSSALSTGTWYRLELHVKSGTGTGVIEGRIDGVAFASSTTATIDSSGAGSLGVGTFNTGSADLYFDDLAINDTTGLSQNSWPGAGSIIHLQPNAAGDNNAFATQVGGTAGAANNFTRVGLKAGVQENPPDDATSYNADNVTNDTDMFNLEDTPVAIGSGDTINVVQGGFRAAGVGSFSNASFQVQVKKTTGGTVAPGTTIFVNSTAWVTNDLSNLNSYALTLYQDPDATNWTKATLDTTQLGYKIVASSSNAMKISTVWLLVDSTPAAGTTTSTSTSSSTSTSTSTSSTSSSTSTSSTSSSTSVSTSTSSTSSSTSSTSSSTSTTTIAPGTIRAATLHRWHRMSPLARVLGV